ncbi:hypothetical protein RB625_34175 [Streptomyces californicus]|uniref:hypothetical protein n=1 Tax=Streptomyces californicus TaxID=67351 RepID=UPI00296FC3AD|nr:hypothetical protein [Streptomyces californicus]MDW4903455.1 hypothetical protein [Streptomyces californicus]
MTTPREPAPSPIHPSEDDEPGAIRPDHSAEAVETLDARVQAHADAAAHAEPTEPAQDENEREATDSEPVHEPCARPDCTVCADPVDGLVHTAATTRSLDEVLALIRLLEQAPQGDETAGETVRTAAVERPVDDVAELVARLSEAPQATGRADQAIHAAAALRPISDISHLMALLHRPPHDQHAGEEAVHAAATELTVEELAELIGQLQSDRAATTPEDQQPPLPAGADGPPPEHRSPSPGSTAPSGAAPESPGPRLTATPGAASPHAPRPARDRRPPQDVRHNRPRLTTSPWLRLVTAAVLVLCGAAHFPLQLADLSTTGLALSAGTSGVCLLLALGMLLRNALPAMAAGALFTGLLAAAHVIIPKTANTTLATALHGGGILATLAAAAAALVCLLALAITLTLARSRRPLDTPARPTVRSGRAS